MLVIVEVPPNCRCKSLPLNFSQEREWRYAHQRMALPHFLVEVGNVLDIALANSGSFFECSRNDFLLPPLGSASALVQPDKTAFFSLQLYNIRTFRRTTQVAFCASGWKAPNILFFDPFSCCDMPVLLWCLSNRFPIKFGFSSTHSRTSHSQCVYGKNSIRDNVIVVIDVRQVYNPHLSLFEILSQLRGLPSFFRYIKIICFPSSVQDLVPVICPLLNRSFDSLEYIKDFWRYVWCKYSRDPLDTLENIRYT